MAAVDEVQAALDERLSLAEFLAQRLTPPFGVGPVSLRDMERAIAQGASGQNAADSISTVTTL